MAVELKQHNQKLYNNLVEMFSKENKCLLSEATGLGKSYIAAKLIEDSFIDKKILYVSPMSLLKNEFLKTLSNEIDDFSLDNIDTITYQGLASQYKRYNVMNNHEDDYSDKEYVKDSKYLISNQSSLFELSVDGDYHSIVPKKYDLIIFDETHRVAAPQWGKCALKLQRDNPQAKILGLSATPNRYFKTEDYGEVNIIEQFFAGNTVIGMDVWDAIDNEVFYKPSYIKTAYSIDFFDSSENKFEEAIRKSNRISEIEKNKLIEKLDMARVLSIENFNKAVDKYFIPQVEKLKDNGYKILVFTSNIEEMGYRKETLDPIFEKLADKLGMKFHSSIIHSKMSDNEKQKSREDFDSLPGLNILYAVNMFDEGYHIGINAVIFMRNTKSFIKYHQQLGRVMELDLAFDLLQEDVEIKDYHPVVFDVVNNIESAMELSEPNSSNGSPGSKLNKNRSKEYIDKITIECFDVNALKVFEEIKRNVNSEIVYRNARSYIDLAEMLKVNPASIKKWIEGGRTVDELVEEIQKGNVPSAMFEQHVYKGDIGTISELVNRHPEIKVSQDYIFSRILDNPQLQLEDIAREEDLSVKMFTVQNPKTGEVLTTTIPMFCQMWEEVINRPNKIYSTMNNYFFEKSGLTINELLFDEIPDSLAPKVIVEYDGKTLEYNEAAILMYGGVDKATNDPNYAIVLGSLFEGMDPYEVKARFIDKKVA